MRAHNPQYYWYLANLGCFVVPQGIQTVLFPWLVAVRLDESADRLGIAQMSLLLPAGLLILFGGLLADRVDPRRVLVGFQLIAAMPALVLAALLWSGHLSYVVMVLYALSMGLVVAFVQPARDGMLNRIAAGDLQRTVTVVTALTFGGQIFGYVAASFTDVVGPVALLVAQSAILVVGALSALRLAPTPPRPAADISGLAQIRQGLAIVYRSPRMRPAVIMLMAMSMFYGGSFLVLNPIIVRDLYQGDAAEISWTFAAFMVGTITSTVLLVITGGMRRQGRGFLLAILGGGAVLSVATLGVSLPVYTGIIFAWGMCGGVAISMGRTIMQESAPEDYRSRVMSIFSLGAMGGTPIGALIMGFVAQYLGPLSGLVVAVLGACSCAVALWLTTDLYRLEPLRNVRNDQ